MVCGIWFGNDDYSPTNRMTGGSLPAMTWHEIMEYAHEGIEVKQLPGVPVPARPRPTTLTRRGADILVEVERLMEDASRKLPPAGPKVSGEPPKPGAALTRPETVASATADGTAQPAGAKR